MNGYHNFSQRGDRAGKSCARANRARAQRAKLAQARRFRAARKTRAKLIHEKFSFICLCVRISKFPLSQRFEQRFDRPPSLVFQKLWSQALPIRDGWHTFAILNAEGTLKDINHCVNIIKSFQKILF